MTSPGASTVDPLSPLVTRLVESEAQFYSRYDWCLNVFPTVAQMAEHLRGELEALGHVPPDWRKGEIHLNLFLLTCGIADAVDDYLLGRGYDFSKAAAVAPILRPAVRFADCVLEFRQRIRGLRLRSLRRWRSDLEASAMGLAQRLLGIGNPVAELADLGPLLARLRWLPSSLQNTRVRIAAAFRSQDLSHHDVVALGRKLVDAFPARHRPLLLVGLRTAGSYFVPLLRAYLDSEGFRQVETVTLRPKRGIPPWERVRLTRLAAGGGLGVLVDEPVNSGSTLAKCVSLLNNCGFSTQSLVALFPVHPSRRTWSSDFHPPIPVLPLEPEEWYKPHALAPPIVEARLAEYFPGQKVVAVREATGFNTQLERMSDLRFHSRVKRVYEVDLQTAAGPVQTRYVLAKGVGWGWLSYHAFLVSARLGRFLPPVLGLREGVLFTEWLPAGELSGQDRETSIQWVADYLATRAKLLRLGEDPTPAMCQDGRHQGLERLSSLLARAYGWQHAAALRRPAVEWQLALSMDHVPSLIDGRMHPSEWIRSGSSLRKTDFEHHGMGKTELNVTDPAYDLADTMLGWGLSQPEEDLLIARYRECSGDDTVEHRLFLYKLLAGAWSMARAIDLLEDDRLLNRHDELNRRYLEALRFLVLQTTRYCAGFCDRPARAAWTSPLAVLDVDGVLDKQIFGFPSTTAAGIKAVSLLHNHGVGIALNTARSVPALQAYCHAYGFVGGVAEYGSYVWDGVKDRERVLVGEESLREIGALRDALIAIPGVHLDDEYRYSIRAFVYEKGATLPLPTALIRGLVAELKLERLTWHQHFTDSMVTAAETDKGLGLDVLLDLADCPDTELLAIGDSGPDLLMFRRASRSFAPAQIPCRQAARLAGCRIASRSYQPGFLESAHFMIHPTGRRCLTCQTSSRLRTGDLFSTLLILADRSRPGLLLRALLDPRAVKVFAQ